MKQYLLSIYQPDGDAPPPEILEKVMRDVNALVEETKAAGVWVFNGGLHPPSTATVVRYRTGGRSCSCTISSCRWRPARWSPSTA